MNIKGIIFDLDGTLVNTVCDVASSINFALEMEGFPLHDIPHYKAVMGTGIMVLISKCVPLEFKDNKEVIERVHSNYETFYARDYAKTSKPYDGIKEVLKVLKENNYRLAVLSNKTDKFTNKLIKELFAEDTFEFISGRRAGIPLKPDPTAAINIAKFLGISKEETMYVGDSEVDVQTAHNGNMVEGTVTWGFRSTNELVNAGATNLFEKPKDILTFLAKNDKNLQ
ncbi:MAG: HAD family hydrolase [Clostridia bacterium]